MRNPPDFLFHIVVKYRHMGKSGNVTIKDIAFRTGFSKSTVSRVLCYDAHVSPDTREKILACAKELNFEPNFFAKGLKTRCSKTIAFFVPNIEIMIYPAIIQAMAAETRERGYTILLCDIQEDKNIAKEYVRKLKGRNVDGFIFSTAFMEQDHNEEIQVVLKEGIPCVHLLRTDNSASSVILDNVKGSEIGVEYLFERGKRKIAFLQGQEYLQLYQDRYEGYVRSLGKRGIAIDKELVWYGYKGSERIASSVVMEKMKSGIAIDAIFCASDNLAVDAIHALSEMGIKVPDDISVIGYDNVPISELFIPRLTSIGQPFKEMGKKAVDVLIDMIEGRIPDKSQDYVFEPFLIERDTVR